MLLPGAGCRAGGESARASEPPRIAWLGSSTADEAVREATSEPAGDRALDVRNGLAAATLRFAYDTVDRVYLSAEGHRLLFERVRATGVVEAAVPGDDRR